MGDVRGQADRSDLLFDPLQGAPFVLAGRPTATSTDPTSDENESEQAPEMM